MTIEAAKLLDDAFDIFLACAKSKEQAIAMQTPGHIVASFGPKSPYDAAAALCLTLIPQAYNFNHLAEPQKSQAVESIWVEMVDRQAVLPMADAQKFTEDCPDCGWTKSSYAHYTECIAI